MRLLLLDNHSSHLTYEFIKFADEHGIILFTLPPHTTHFLQPLDGLPFQVYKHYHGQAVTNAARDGYDTFERREFLEKLPSIRQKTFTGKTVRSSFKSCGLHPFNPSSVTDLLKKKMVKDDTPPIEIWYGEGGGPTGSPVRSNTPSSITSSPKTLQRFQKDIRKVQKGLAGIQETLDTLTPNLKKQIDHVFSGGLHQAESNANREEQIDRLLESAKQRNKPKSRRQVKGPASLSSTGYLTVKDAKRHINKRMEEESHQGQGRKRRRQENEKENNSPTTASPM